MEKRNVSITLEKAKEWYQQGGELKEISLQAYKESELINWPIELCDNRLSLPVAHDLIPNKIFLQWKLHKLLEFLNPKDFNPGYSDFYVPRIWWYKELKYAKKYANDYNEVTVGSAVTNRGETLYINVGGCSDDGFVAGLFAGSSDDVFSGAGSDDGAINQLKCATPEIREHLEKNFWRVIIMAYYGETIISTSNNY